MTRRPDPTSTGNRQASAPTEAVPAPRRPVAVALSHERGGERLPRIVAAGRGAVAEQILELAFAHGVKVREDADLAEILAHLYRASQAAGPLPDPQLAGHAP